MKSLRLGTIACLHGNLKNAKRFCTEFKKENVDAVALIGDIPSDENQKKNLTEILKIFSKLNKTIFVSPGSHERHDEYYSVIKLFKKNKNIIDCTKRNKINLNGYDLVFIPGTDIGPANLGFRIIKDMSGMKRLNYLKETHPHMFQKKFNVYPISKISKLVNRNSIVLCHVPPLFKNKNAIDVAMFGTANKEFSLKKKDIKKLKLESGGTISPNFIYMIDEARKIKSLGYPMKINIKNVGMKILRDMINKRKVTKYICGHIHEAGGRAVTRNGKHIKENIFSKELFYNCSPGKNGRAGIIEFSGDDARFKNIQLTQ